MISADEIAALALTLQAHQISSMELRTVLEFLRGRGFLTQPATPVICDTCQASQEARP